jgi:hypothetical protein
LIRQEAKKHRRHFFYVNQVGGNDELVFDGHSMGFDPAGEEILRAADFDEDFALVNLDERNGELVLASAPLVRDEAVSEVDAAHRALVLGLRDYTQKCGFSSAVIGLSGGVDSAVTAALATAALGPGHVLGVSMPTRYSSPGSVADAEELARALGIGYELVPIDAIFQAYLDGLAPLFAGTQPCRRVSAGRC